MKSITLLGCGMVGTAMAADLAQTYHVLAADQSEDALKRLVKKASVEAVRADLSNPKIIDELIKKADLVVGAVPGYMGFQTMKRVLESGKNMVDIAFFDEDPFLLDKIARKNHVTAVVDCGVAPGISNLILGYHAGQMELDSFECLVGGLPVIRSRPYEYKAPFSPIDVLEEYTRPARLKENGKVVTRPALSEPELVEFPALGTLEAFNTDGLRSLLKTQSVPNMKEKTLRYPGHIEIMRVIRETGFLSKEPVDVMGHSIRPLDLTTRLLFPLWKLGDSEPEFTVMRIILIGRQANVIKKIRYDLLDRYDAKTGFSSMARTTGYSCTAAAHLILNGDYSREGISPPEFIGTEPGCFEKMMAYQEARNIHYVRTEQIVMNR
ncbi:MAG TPA: saccharopine dehydrogenase [bacterium]|nr:saccharopine dehydrogenase [bacterium]